MNYYTFTDESDYRLYRVTSDECVLELTVDNDDLSTLTVETAEGFSRVPGITASALYELLEKMAHGDYEIGAGELFSEH